MLFIFGEKLTPLRYKILVDLQAATYSANLDSEHFSIIWYYAI